MKNAAERADRWDQIRKNAAERAAKANRESPSVAYGDGSEEETIEARVERIKRRVAELTGNLPDSSLKRPVNRGTVPPQLTTPATS
jgi:ribosomal protein L25 (general stress protein Ctc)